MKIESLRKEISSCVVCAKFLPHTPRPIVSIDENSRILIIGQAPGRRVHESGIPWNDASGDLLREWMGITRDTFYDRTEVALLPMGFCFPGNGKSGDLPPRPECAPLWHPRVLTLMANVKLTVLIGSYACAHYAPEFDGKLTEAVHAFESLLPTRIALPHPSPRNRPWLAKNPWFEAKVIPALRHQVAIALA